MNQPVSGAAAPRVQVPAQTAETQPKKEEANINVQPSAPTTVGTASTTNTVATETINASSESTTTQQTTSKTTAAPEGGDATVNLTAEEKSSASGYGEKIQENIYSAWNSTSSTVSEWARSATDKISNFGTYTKESFENLGTTISSGVNSGLSYVKYENLNKIGLEANNYAYNTITGNWNSFTSTRAISWINETAHTTAQTVSENVPSASTWLPAAVFGLSSFAAVKSLKAASENFNAGNLKRAVTQIVVGGAALALAGGIAYGSPIGTGVSNKVSVFFAKQD